MTLDRRIAASPAEVFADWTQPERLEWYLNPNAPQSATVPITVDLRVGGAWCVPMIIDRETAYMTGGVYREIVPGQSIRFLWGARPGWPDPDDEREALLSLEGDDGHTVLAFQLTWRPRDDDDVTIWPMCVAGWNDTIDRLVQKHS
ncbi:MAG: hypothetical protein RL499_1065 [Actinomycetota bacterium]|jgi:uncharacterized protein YndB with AHSA1/START domain